MARPRPTPTAEDWRANREDLVKRITDQQRKLGQLPDQAAAERFVEPILRQTEAQLEELRRRELVTPAEPAEQLAPDQVRWNLGTDTFSGPMAETVERALASRRARESAHDAALRAWLQNLRLDPEWRTLIESILFRHSTMDRRTGRLRLTPYGERRLREIVRKTVRLYGHLTPEARAIAERIDI